MQVWSVSHVMLTEINVLVGMKQLYKSVQYSYVVSHAIRISCINSSVDFNLGTCS